MRKFKRHKGEKEQLSEEEISRYKDFARFRANYDDAVQGIHKKPLYRNPRMFLMLVIILLIAWIISMETEREAPVNENTPIDSVQTAPNQDQP